MAQTQEEKLAAALRVELHNTSCQVQSLQAETESLRALVSRPGRALAFLVTIFNSQLPNYSQMGHSLQGVPISQHRSFESGKHRLIPNHKCSGHGEGHTKTLHQAAAVNVNS